MTDSTTPLKPPVFLILLALVEQERHGYALAQAVRELSGGSVRLATGPLYRHLHRLLSDGLVAEARPSKRKDEDPRRRYYRLTEAGRRVARREAGRLQHLVAVSHDLNLLTPKRSS